MSDPAVLFDRRRQHGLKREVLLSEAANLFHQRGYGHTSLDDIATHLGITKAALYHYFESKQQMLFECFALGYNIGDEAFESAVKEGRTGRERLEFYCRRYLVAGIAAARWMVPIREMTWLTQEMRQKLNARRTARRDRLRELVVDGIADGSIRPCNPKIVVSAWAGAASWIIDTYSADGALAPDAIADELVRLLFVGCGSAALAVGTES